MESGKIQTRRLKTKPVPGRSLPTLQDPNPCAGAPCRTADNRRGAACCRDLTLEIVLTERDMDRDLESLLRARQAPYLCKVSQESIDIIECEVISTCGYLGDDGLRCTLHDRVRAGGEDAKPSICSDWPHLEPGDTGHPGCRLIPSTARHGL